MRRSLLFRLAALSQVILLLSGCLSMRTTGKAKTTGEGGGVAVKIYPDDDARKAKQLATGSIVGELQRNEKGKWVPVFRSLDPKWTVLGLPPGDYRLRFPARLDDQGNVVALDTTEKRIRIKKGEVVQVDTTIEHFPTALVAAGVVTAVVAAVLLHDWLEDHDLPLPPLPPPPPELLDAIFYVSIDVPGPQPWPGAVVASSPVVTSHFPEEGALVASRRIRLTFALSEPIDADELEQDGVAVLGEKSGLVPGHVRYDAGHWWVIWEPDGDLPREDLFHVTLAADAVEDHQGHELAAPVSFSFRTTG